MAATNDSVIGTLSKLQAAHNRGALKIQSLLEDFTSEIVSRFAVIRSEYFP
jgi:hypothetical protein